MTGLAKMQPLAVGTEYVHRYAVRLANGKTIYIAVRTLSQSM